VIEGMDRGLTRRALSEMSLGKGTPLLIALERPGGSVSRYETVPPPPSHPRAAANFSYAGRLFKTLLLATRWAPGLHRRPEGGGRIHPGTLFPRGERAFDREMMEEIYGHLSKLRFVPP